MDADTCLLDSLIRGSRDLRATHPWLKRLTMRAVNSALRQEKPDAFADKCHGAALSIFMILRTLQIKSLICCGSVSWLFGSVDMAGTARQSKSGFWSTYPSLASPHAWVLTEFGEIVDLSCSYFHLTIGQKNRDDQAHDVIPRIWVKTDVLSGLPAVNYEASAKCETIELAGCDELARSTVSRAVATFWGRKTMSMLLQPTTDVNVWIDDLEPAGPEDGEFLTDWDSLKTLRMTNSWVNRNSSAPSSQGLIWPPLT